MKVIGGKHYVEGGPECPDCAGYGNWPAMKAAGYAWPGRAVHTEGDCHACHGTGLLAVELWPDAVKIDRILNRLASRYFKEGFKIARRQVQRNKKRVWRYFIETGITPCAMNVEGEDFSAALTAAVLAVAEEAE